MHETLKWDKGQTFQASSTLDIVSNVRNGCVDVVPVVNSD